MCCKVFSQAGWCFHTFLLFDGKKQVFPVDSRIFGKASDYQLGEVNLYREQAFQSASRRELGHIQTNVQLVKFKVYVPTCL